MKKIFFFLSLLICLSASAQWTLSGTKVREGYGRAWSTKDSTAFTSPGDSLILAMGSDSLFHYKYKGYWQTLSIGVPNTYVKYADTAGIFGRYFTGGILKGASFPALTGDITTPSGSIATTLKNIGTPGTYGSASTVPILTTDYAGRITNVTNTSIQINESQVTNLITDLANKAPITGGTGYIQNQNGSNLSAQTAKFWITDTIKTNGPIVATYGLFTGTTQLSKYQGTDGTLETYSTWYNQAGDYTHFGTSTNANKYGFVLSNRNFRIYAGVNQLAATFDSLKNVTVGNNLSITNAGVIGTTLFVGNNVTTNNGTSISGNGALTIKNTSNIRAELGLVNTEGVNTGSDLYLYSYLDNGTSVQIFKAIRGTGAISFGNTVTIGSIPALGTAATNFLTSNAGVVSSRTPLQTLNDIGGVPLTGATMTGPLILSGDATTPMGAATKNQLDQAIAGLSWKPQARAATTANITLSGTQTVDGVALNVGDTVLVKNQTTQSQNGYYIVAAGAWTRASWGTTGTQIVGSAVYIRPASVANTNGGTQWANSNITAPTIGTDPVTFNIANGPGSYAATNGVTLTGNTFSLDQAFTKNLFSAGAGLSYSNGVYTNTGVTSWSAGTTGLTPSTTTTGAVTLSGTLAIANGGTGQITAAAAFNALSPLTTAGDILYGGTAGAGTRLAAGTATQVLHGGTVPSWSAVSLTTDVSGILPIANGGSGQSTALTLQNITANGNTSNIGVSLTENGNVAASYALYLKRNTDVSPLGFLIQAQNAAVNANIFTVDVAGNVVANQYTGNLVNALTFGAGLNAGSFNNSAASTISIATAGVTNAMLANSTISGVALGGTLSALTMNNGGAGAASGTTFNGSTAQTISYNTIGAPSTTGTNASGTWGINITGTAAGETLATVVGRGNAVTANNIAIGSSAPYSWGTSYRAIQVGFAGSLWSANASTGDVYLSSNAYYSGTAWTISSSATLQPSTMSISSGVLNYYVNPAGAIGSTFTPTSVFSINNTGTITTGIWNAGAVTSSGGITGNNGGIFYETGNLGSSYALQMVRNTNTSPAGYFLQGVNAGITSTIFYLDVNGNFNTSGSITGGAASFTTGTFSSTLQVNGLMLGDANGNFNFNYNKILSNNATYRNMSFGGGGILYRDNFDFLISNNAFYNSSNLWEAKYTNASGIGALQFNGNNFAWLSYNGAVTAGTTYALTNAFSVNGSGAGTFSSSVTASSFITSGGTASQIQARDGSAITAGTGITISAGVISSTSTPSTSAKFTKSAATTVANTVTETSVIGTGVGSTTIAANEMVVGKTYRVKFIVRVATANATSRNILFNLKVGGTTIWSQAPSYALASSGMYLNGEVIFTCQTTGASGTIYPDGAMTQVNSGGGGSINLISSSQVTYTVNTTISNAIDLTATWQDAVAGNTLTVNLLTIETLN